MKSLYEEPFHFESDDKEKDLSQDLLAISDSLSDLGYNPIDQIVGYIMSGDLTYIPRRNNARKQIRQYQPDEIIEELVKQYLKDKSLAS